MVAHRVMEVGGHLNPALQPGAPPALALDRMLAGFQRVNLIMVVGGPFQPMAR